MSDRDHDHLDALVRAMLASPRGLGSPRVVASPADVERIRRALVTAPPGAVPPGLSFELVVDPLAPPGEALVVPVRRQGLLDSPRRSPMANELGAAMEVMKQSMSRSYGTQFFGVQRAGGGSGRLSGLQLPAGGIFRLPDPPAPLTATEIADCFDPQTPGVRLVVLRERAFGCRPADWDAISAIDQNPSLPGEVLRRLLVDGDDDAWLNPSAQLVLLEQPGVDLLRGALLCACDAAGIERASCCFEEVDPYAVDAPPEATPAEVFAAAFALPGRSDEAQRVLDRLRQLFPPEGAGEGGG
jgi:hypothetical protein